MDQTVSRANDERSPGPKMPQQSGSSQSRTRQRPEVAIPRRCSYCATSSGIASSRDYHSTFLGRDSHKATAAVYAPHTAAIKLCDSQQQFHMYLQASFSFRRLMEEKRWKAMPSSTTFVLACLTFCLLYLTFRDGTLATIYLSPAPAPREDVRQLSCMVNTCNDEWQATDGTVDANQDNAGCSSVRSMIRMKDIKPNVTGHWCKAYRAVQVCRQRRYRYYIFRDDDTKIDIFPLLDLARTTGADMIASYKAGTKRVVTNWFLLDTHSERACAKMRKWWSLARIDHPEHDQKYFNKILHCGKDGLYCIDKRDNLLNEVHCRSALGHWRHRKRQFCLRYQTKSVPRLL